MASEVAQIPAEETPAVAAAEKPEEPEKPAAQPADSTAAPAAAPAVEKAAEDGEADKKDEAGKQDKQQQQDGEEPKKEEAAAAPVAAKSEAPPAQKFNVHKTNFEKDIIYLYQFSRTPLLPSLSPYCLKVETWLRLVGLKYEVSFGDSPGNLGKLSGYPSKTLETLENFKKITHENPEKRKTPRYPRFFKAFLRYRFFPSSCGRGREPKRESQRRHHGVLSLPRVCVCDLPCPVTEKGIHLACPLFPPPMCVCVNL